MKRVGLMKLPQVLMNGVPMSQDQLTQDEFEEAAVTAIFKGTPDLQKAVYHVRVKFTHRFNP